MVSVVVLGCLESQQYGSAQTIDRAATLRKKLLIKLAISPIHNNLLTSGQTALALIIYRQPPDRVAIILIIMIVFRGAIRDFFFFF